MDGATHESSIEALSYAIMAAADYYDALVVGGGPGGSTAATYLAQAGKRVLVLERDCFPRFHIGESLLPYNRRIFEELGVLGKLEGSGFVRKVGAQFHIGNGNKALKLVFRNGCYTKETVAFQVERAAFDKILLDHSAEKGAQVRQGWCVTRFEQAPGGVRVAAKGPVGEPGSFHGRFLIDASGRGNFSGNQEGLRVIHPGLRKVAVFGHFTGVHLDEGDPRGDTVIVRLKDKWFWIIPLGEKTSVGCVLDEAELRGGESSPAEMFEVFWRGSKEMSGRMKDARLVSRMHVTSDFSYYNRRLTGPRLLRVGDAAGFMDPIFSAGVYLAMYSAKLAAEAVLASLSEASDGAKRLEAYEREVFRAMKYYWDLVEGFYTTPFMELFMEPRPKWNLPDAMVAVLAGELHGGWKLEWRRRLFFLLVRLQSQAALVPRLSFEE